MNRPQFSARIGLFAATLAILISSSVAFAHGVAHGDQRFIENSAGSQLIPFVYLGAKHMVTGYDHLLFLVGVIFFLYRMKEVALYVSLFAVGHSVTLLYGVLSGTNVNPFIVDAIIGFSVVYKGLDNMGAFQRWFGFQPNTKAAVLIFGLFHGFGLSLGYQALIGDLRGQWPVTNMLQFGLVYWGG